MNALEYAELLLVTMREANNNYDPLNDKRLIIRYYNREQDRLYPNEKPELIKGTLQDLINDHLLYLDCCLKSLKYQIKKSQLILEDIDTKKSQFD